MELLKPHGSVGSLNLRDKSPLKTNGLDIMGAARELPIQSNDYKTQTSPLGSRVSGSVSKHAYGRIDQPLAEFDLRSPRLSRFHGKAKDPYELDDGVKLVPCRWSNSGWKYVKEDPSEHKFFGSPNRVNSHGFDQKKSKSVIRNAGMGRNLNYQNQQSAQCTNCRSNIGKYGEAMLTRENNDTFQSSYNQYFNSSNEIKIKNWQDKGAIKEEFGKFGAKDSSENNGNIIQWAGSYHQRQDFNKKKDHLASWTDTLFSH